MVNIFLLSSILPPPIEFFFDENQALLPFGISGKAVDYVFSAYFHYTEGLEKSNFQSIYVASILLSQNTERCLFRGDLGLAQEEYPGGKNTAGCDPCAEGPEIVLAKGMPAIWEGCRSRKKTRAMGKMFAKNHISPGQSTASCV